MELTIHQKSFLHDGSLLNVIGSFSPLSGDTTIWQRGFGKRASRGYDSYEKFIRYESLFFSLLEMSVKWITT
jgi:hypothetical protein